ncbi:MAG: PAS domain-containing sensor histidine kinase [Caldilinea sp.]
MVTDPSDRATRVNEQRYRHLFEHAPICIMVVDLNAQAATILEVNRRAALVFGYTAGELMGKSVTTLLPDAAIPAGLSIIHQVQQGQTVTAETLHQHRDGTCFPARIIAAPDPADPNHMIVTIEDISAEKQRRSEAEAIDAERRRIAHEIHDGVAQNLAGLRFKSALWSHQADEAPPSMRAALDELLVVLTVAITDLRRAIFALRPVDLEAMGFFPALAQLVADFGDQNQLVTRLELPGRQDALPAVYELPLFRILQEALNNVGQHALATQVDVRLTKDVTGGVIVSVRDNGQGFESRTPAPIDRDGHFGLRQMRERIVDLGGSLDIHSAPGTGTELIITLPPIVQGDAHAAG